MQFSRASLVLLGLLALQVVSAWPDFFSKPSRPALFSVGLVVIFWDEARASDRSNAKESDSDPRQTLTLIRIYPTEFEEEDETKPFEDFNLEDQEEVEEEEEEERRIMDDFIVLQENERYFFEEREVSAAPKNLPIVGKTAKQSTTFKDLAAGRAVDGSTSTDIKGGSCAHTRPDTFNPWWRVDLGGFHCISKVTILNRGTCCSFRLENAVFRAGVMRTVTENPACGLPVTADEAAPLGGTVVRECQEPLFARYVSVDIPGIATLQLCEVTVEAVSCNRTFSKELSIVGKPSSQSSTGYSLPAALANDGNTAGIIAATRSCSHVATFALNPWWRVDLENEHFISKVTLYNRADCCSTRLAGVVIRAGLDITPTKNPACGPPITLKEATPLGGIISRECPEPLQARYISVDFVGRLSLALCEVQVEEVAGDPSREMSLEGKPTEQSTTRMKFTAERAVDGSSSAVMAKSCSHTLVEKLDPWWRVDLGGYHCITKVTVLNRLDCCNTRLEHAVIRAGVLKTPTDNPACGAPISPDEAKAPGDVVVRLCGKPLLARYVSVDIPGESTLQLCEVTVDETPCQGLGLVRLPIVGRPASQSATHTKYVPGWAVDGGISSNFVTKSCSATVMMANPWWRVDLGAVHCIAKVTVLNRKDCCSDRLAGAQIRAGLETTATENEPCGAPVTDAEARVRGAYVSRECDGPIVARYLTVDIPRTTSLQLCEVTVMEVPCGVSTATSIVGRPAEQSTTMSTHVAGNAVDGDTTSFMSKRKNRATCSVTKPNSMDPWWKVDLGEERCISKVRILNRRDCCSLGLQGAVVRGGPSSTPTENDACGSPISSAEAKPLGAVITKECTEPLLARYLSVDIQGSGVLSMCEVMIEEADASECGGNVRLPIVGMPAIQSSSFNHFTTADKAVDGSPSADVCRERKCSHTAIGGTDPWWRVDLGAEHCIVSVSILNRGDCCSERLATAVVRAGLSQTPTENGACGDPVTAAEAEEGAATVRRVCPEPQRARYVSVDIPGPAMLQLCEVAVEERLPGRCGPTPDPPSILAKSP